VATASSQRARPSTPSRAIPNARSSTVASNRRRLAFNSSDGAVGRVPTRCRRGSSAPPVPLPVCWSRPPGPPRSVRDSLARSSTTVPRTRETRASR
jgi:hypothetical protein